MRAMSLHKLLVAVLLLALPAFAADAGVKPRVAAVYFRNNSASDELGFFAKGLAALITADLADSGRVVALDRERLQEVLAEKKLGETKCWWMSMRCGDGDARTGRPGLKTPHRANEAPAGCGARADERAARRRPAGQSSDGMLRPLGAAAGCGRSGGT